MVQVITIIASPVGFTSTLQNVSVNMQVMKWHQLDSEVSSLMGVIEHELIIIIILSPNM